MDKSACTIIREYGVLHMRGALSEKEQGQLLLDIAKDVPPRPPTNPIPANFGLSSGRAGTPGHRQPLHKLGELLYTRFAGAVGAQLSPAEVAAEPSLRRIARVHSGEQPVRVNYVAGVGYLAHSVLDTHQDGPQPLYTMSVALGDACDFVVGAKPKRNAYRNLRSGKPVTIRMESGDAIFFDGGSVPHAVPRIHKGSAPSGWAAAAKRAGLRGSAARVSVLFREPDTG